MPARKKKTFSRPTPTPPPAPPPPDPTQVALTELNDDLAARMARSNADRLRDAEHRLQVIEVRNRAHGERPGPEGTVIMELIRVEIAVLRLAERR